MQAFVPQKIIIEAAVAHEALTQRLKGKFEKVPFEIVENYQSWKEPAPISAAKRILALAEQRGRALKPFPKIKHAINLGDYVFNPVSNCHLECSYCILQSYLQNNPVLTVFANTGYFLQAIREASQVHAHTSLRFGTGELSDSLALDDLTELSRELVPFFAELSNAYLELKTKSNCISHLLKLDPKGHTVISWSLSPQNIVEREELKCASLAERLDAARQVQQAGYAVGLHLDPMIYFEGWEQAYETLVEQISQNLDPQRIAWVSIGSLRFDKELKAIATERFPHTSIFAEDFVAAPDGKMRYFKTLRSSMYRRVWTLLEEWSQDFPRYLCMEAPWMWEEVTRQKAPRAEEIEAKLVQRLRSLSREKIATSLCSSQWRLKAISLHAPNKFKIS